MRIRSLFWFLMCFSVAANAQNLNIKSINKNLYVFTTYSNYNGNRVSANGMYLITNGGVVLFDTPWDVDLYQILLDSIQVKHQQKVVKVYATHSHEDRAGGFGYYNDKGIATYATAQTNAILKEQKKPLSTNIITVNKFYDFGGEQFYIGFVGGGHSPDNIYVWFPKYKVLDGGCLIKSAEAIDLGYLGEANLSTWKLSIEKLLSNYKNAQIIIPGHDNWELNGSLENTLSLIKKVKN